MKLYNIIKLQYIYQTTNYISRDKNNIKRIYEFAGHL